VGLSADIIDDLLLELVLLILFGVAAKKAEEFHVVVKSHVCSQTRVSWNYYSICAAQSTKLKKKQAKKTVG